MKLTRKNIGDLVSVNDFILGVQQPGIIVNIGYYDNIERVIVDNDVDYVYVRNYSEKCDENGFITVLLNGKLLNLNWENEFEFITFEMNTVRK